VTLSGKRHPNGNGLSAFELHPKPWSAEYISDEQVYLILDGTSNTLLEMPLDDFPMWDFTPTEIVNLIVKSINTADEAELYKKAFQLACGYIATFPDRGDDHPETVADEFLKAGKISLKVS